ncbi:tRNA (adenosine(37)-N6)-threonylcarbamoyltransferase complex dimerization subunit type 1 TsaB [Nocardioides marmoribigeumensis]|uniref:tRNA threonylcarbamoyl adenosine modification protein YeaZ n=1 Tax=Nocardioides marmoribigeumensis TaxID=433649 RepID=A0ABU2BZP2_9ACTN|nr:tRNA (adenosine(37)-N6)-threonylcarbamoyltransferase complex dimerization subunit type 1 TsaB [Nocardioides marmoribigeumensis]MDR7363868.1 tRNA threonylcarbamoyl adenosine modification protein YeaZ [Nocardioides marmoribigeumensis]
MLLALDTSTPLVSVAVYDDTAGHEGTVLASLTSDRPMKHGESVAPLVEQALAGAGVARGDLTGIVAGTGPGPFTGLRVGLVSARVFGLALGVPVRGVCSLDAVAAAVSSSESFVVVTDARRKELFHASYSSDGRRLTDPAVSRPADVLAGLPEDTLVVGPGVLVYPDAFARTGGPTTVDAAVLARLAATGATTEPEPIYLRRPDAVAPGPPKKVS